MSDPVRWLTAEGGVPESLRSTIADAAREAPSPEAMASLAAQLSPVLEGPHVPPTFGFELSVVAFAIGLAAAAAGLAVDEPAPAVHRPSPRAASAATDPFVEPDVRLEAPTVPLPPPARPLASARRRPDVEEALPSAPPAPPEPASTEPAPIDSGVPEVALLDGARAAVRTQPARALSLTMEHVRRFPDGMLVEERELIAIEALLRVGRREMADARAMRFRDAHPSSVHLPRLDRLLAGAAR